MRDLLDHWQPGTEYGPELLLVLAWWEQVARPLKHSSESLNGPVVLSVVRARRYTAINDKPTEVVNCYGI